MFCKKKMNKCLTYWTTVRLKLYEVIVLHEVSVKLLRDFFNTLLFNLTTTT